MGTIADIGRGLQRYGWRVGEHPEFGNVGRHSSNDSLHYTGEAIDVTDWRYGDAGEGPEYEGGPKLGWRDRTRRLKERAQGLGLFTEVLGPGDKGHEEHAHLALKGKAQNWDDQRLEWLATGRWRRPDGGFDFALPGSNAAGSGSAGGMAGAAPQSRTVTEQRTVINDWKPDASAADRSTDPSSQAYWQRQDMRLWAEANPQLARAAMARAGADPSWLEKPLTHTEAITRTETTPAAGSEAGTAAAAPRPPDRGALNGNRVGGPARQLQPYAFEIHADAAEAAGGRTGFIGSYLDRTNSLFQALDQEYGNYGPNHSRGWRNGNLGAPRRGLSIIETRTAGPGMADPKQQERAADRLLGAFLRDPDVRSGARPVHVFAGHADTTLASAHGAADGDAPEARWNTGVFGALRQRVQQQGLRNFQFHDPIVDNNDDGPNANWNRAKQIREQWLKQQQRGQQ